MAGITRGRTSKRPAKKSKDGGFLEAAQKKASDLMKGLNTKYGGGARKRRLDEVIEEQTSGRKKPRK